jgi:cytochrome c oxidase subunit 2
MACARTTTLIVLLLGIALNLTAAEPTVDECVSLYNPSLYEHGPAMAGAFDNPASDIARDVQANAWFSTLVFLPFLILPQILLLVAMFKFRTRAGDTRKAATFIHNTKLENAWTAIPVLTLFIVAVPVYPLLWKMEMPATKSDLVVTITGKMFKWDYEYKRQLDLKGETIKIGQDVAGFQEPLILIKDKTVSLNITSNDVNHAWWIPAFGVKKDAINGRFNSTWFTPLKFGFFKGQCAELCGPDHGTMIITAVVVDDQQFDRYIELQRHRADTVKIFGAVEPAPGVAFSQEALRTAVSAYLSKDKSATRVFALKYWIASNYASLEHYPPIGTTQAQIVAATPGKRAIVDAAIAAVVADKGGSPEVPVSADSEPQKSLVSNISQEGQK